MTRPASPPDFEHGDGFRALTELAPDLVAVVDVAVDGRVFSGSLWISGGCGVKGPRCSAEGIEIVPDDLQGEAIRALLRAHLASARQHSPPESVHALDVDGLRQPGLSFWSVWRDGELLGCCALKELDATHAEIKSMRTAPGHERRGVGARLLQHLIDEAHARGYRRLSLETGSMEAFAPARRLYERFGFVYCGPFAAYREDPWSRFMRLDLESDRTLPGSEA